jgi:uncharacterized membrane protein (UPF0127 family)
MQQVRVLNLNRPLRSPVLALYCASFFCRLRGLTFRRQLPDDQGLLLVQNRESRVDTSIHMFFVWFALAVVWIDTGGKVVDVRLAKPWRPAYIPRSAAKYVLEMAASRISDFVIGDQVEFDASA